MPGSPQRNATPPVPQLTELGERLGKDTDREYLDSLLERLSARENGDGQEAFKSARHIVQTVWSMQHLDKLSDKLSENFSKPS